MGRKPVTADTDTDQLQDVIRAQLALNITTPGTPEHDAVSSVGGGGGGLVVSNSPAKPLEGKSATYWVTTGVSWPSGLVWSDEPDAGTAPTIASAALVSFVTVAGVTYAVAGSTFTVAASPDSTPPSAPTGLSANPDITSVALSWTAATDNVFVAGYEYRIGAGSWVDAGAGTTETVGDLTPSTTYTFQVRAYDAAGNRGTAASVTTTTDAGATPFMSYPFTEGSGTTTAEASGKQALTVTAGAWTASGHVGPGITSSAVGVHAQKTYSPAGSYPIGAWDGFTFGAWIKGGTAGAQISIMLGSTEMFIGVKDNEFVTNLGTGLQGFLDVDSWHHFALAVDFDPSTSDNYTMFLDGVSVKASSGNVPNSGVSLDSVLVGSRFDGTNSIIDGFRIYDVALNAAQVVDWMNAT